MAKATGATDLLKTAGKGAVERTLQTFLPEIMGRLDVLTQHMADLRKDTAQQVSGLRAEIAGLRGEIAEVRQDVNARAERTQELINELGLRINTVGTRLDTYFEFARRDSAKMDSWLERLVRVEEAQKARSRRAS